MMKKITVVSNSVIVLQFNSQLVSWNQILKCLPVFLCNRYFRILVLDLLKIVLSRVYQIILSKETKQLELFHDDGSVKYLNGSWSDCDHENFVIISSGIECHYVALIKRIIPVKVGILLDVGRRGKKNRHKYLTCRVCSKFAIYRNYG